MLSLLVPIVLMTGGAGLVLGAVAVLEAGGLQRVARRARGLVAGGGGLAQASVRDATAMAPVDAGGRAPVDGATAPPSYPGGS